MSLRIYYSSATSYIVFDKINLDSNLINYEPGLIIYWENSNFLKLYTFCKIFNYVS